MPTGLSVLLLLPLAAWADGVTPVLEGSGLGLAGGVRFLSGRPLEHLKAGAAVPFDAQLTLWSEAAMVGRASGRFILSYDLWEERFSVVQLETDGRRTMASIAGQTALDAETWCLRRLRLRPAAGGGPMRLKIEIRSPDPRAEPPPAALNLPASLVDLFSRTGRSQGYRVSAETGAFRMADLKAR